MKKSIFACLISPAICFSQNVGIDILPTKARFEVNGAVGLTTAIFGGDGAGMSLQRNPPGIGFNHYHTDASRNMASGGSWLQFLDMNSGSFVLEMNAAQGAPDRQNFSPVRRLTIRQNGNVSVNAGEANATLFVGGSNVNLPSAIFRGTSYHSTFYESPFVNLPNRNTYISGGKNGSLVLINDKLGGDLIIGNGSSKVGINTDPTDTLEVKQVNGRGLALINPSGFNYWELFVEKNLVENAGDLYVYYNNSNLGNFYQGDGKYYNYSDRRVKTNIEPVASALEGVLALRPVEYEMKHTNPGRLRSIGLIAQEVKDVFPDITHHITGDELGYPGLNDLHTMNYNALGPLAIRAIQEQQVKIKTLKTQVDSLRQRVAAAERLLATPRTASPATR
jgi:hypothetical protein